MTIDDAVATKIREVLSALASGRIEPWMASHARAVLPAFRPPQAAPKAPAPPLVVIPGGRQ